MNGYAVEALIVLSLATAVLALFAVYSRSLDSARAASGKRVQAALMRQVEHCVDGRLSPDACARSLRGNATVGLEVLDSAVGRWRDRLPLMHRLLEDSGLAALERRRLVRSKDWTVRAGAAVRLGALRYAPAVPELEQALTDASLDVRLAAGRALAALDAQEATGKILAALALPGSWPLERAAEILADAGPRSGRVLLEQLERNALPASAAVVAIRVLGLLRTAEAAPLLQARLAHDDVEQRIASARALGQIAAPAAAAALCNALADPAWEVRNAAARALGAIRAPEALAPLGRTLADPVWWVRFNSAEALHRIGGVDALCAAGLQHPDRYARDMARQVLEEHGTVVPALAA